MWWLIGGHFVISIAELWIADRNVADYKARTTNNDSDADGSVVHRDFPRQQAGTSVP
ncbi:MAG: hypothetical protein QM758_27510 [Armatimonas sp.]